MITKIVKNIHHNGFAKIRPVLLSLKTLAPSICQLYSHPIASLSLLANHIF